MGGFRKNYRQWIVWVVIITIGYVAASYIIMGGVSLAVATFPDVIKITSVGLLWLRVAVGIASLGIAVWGARVLKLSRVSLKTLGLSRLPSWQDIGLSVAGMVVYMALAAVLLAAARWLPFFDANQPQQLGSTILFGIDRLLAFFALVVFIPIIEEVIFRGLLYGKLREAKMSFWPAALVVSILFGVAHGQLNLGINVFCMSMVASYLRNITGSIWAGVLLHMIKNAIAFVFVYILIRGSGG